MCNRGVEQFASLFSALLLGALLTMMIPACAAPIESGPSYGAKLEGFSYPWPVRHYYFTSQANALDMAYMDVQPTHANGRTVVLLHGKNFCSATWKRTIQVLSSAGYRVIAPDQIGFCKSSKPSSYQFSFQQLAGNTHALLAAAGVSHATILGHSTGGMIAMRYALMYPKDVDQLVLVDPLGLEDWKNKGVPWQSVDEWNRTQRTTAKEIRDYERKNYYMGTWRPDFEPWVDMLAGMYRGPGRKLVAWDSALIYDMIYTQPVIYEINQLQMPVLLMIGQGDRSAIGANLVAPSLRAKLGNYPLLAKEAVARIPHAQLIEFPGVGHAPQIQVPDKFHKALLEGLRLKS